MLILAAFISIETGIQLGLAGLAITVLSKLLLSARRDVKDANKVTIDEVNRRDDNFNKLQERTLEVLVVVKGAMEENKSTMDKVLEKLDEKEK